MSEIDWSRVRWDRVAGLALWALVLVVLVSTPDMAEWPRSILIWATVPVVAVLLDGRATE